MSSCTTTKEAGSSRAEVRKEKKLVDQALVKNAVESKRYIIKFERIYFSYGGIIQLIPRANYLIVDREKAILNTAYMGRQYDIKLKVSNGRSASFDVYVRISKNGYCSVSVSSLKIDNINYTGYLVPISDKTNTLQQGDMI